MPELHINLLGCMRVEYGGKSVDLHLTRSNQVLLAYLLLNRQRLQPREVLAGILWGDLDKDRSRKCLNTAVWRLRKILEPNGCPTGTYLLSTPLGEMGFNPQSDHWLDIAVFEDLIERVATRMMKNASEEEIHQLEEATQLYTGDLLEGFYQDWALNERERFRLLYVSILFYLMQYYRYRQDHEKGLYYGQKILRLEPLREDVQREVMRLYFESGQRALALRQYELCCDILRTELGIAPMEETQELFSQIIQSSDVPLAPVIPPLMDLHLILQHLQMARQRYERAEKDLLQVIQIIEDLVNQNPTSSF